MIIANLEGSLKPSAMQHKKAEISKNQSDSPSLFTNFDFILNFIQNLKNDSKDLQTKDFKDVNKDNLKGDKPYENAPVQLSSQISVNSQSDNPNFILDKSAIKYFVNLNWENISNPEKMQLQSTFEKMQNNEQLRDNILKYLPKEMLEYFEMNFDKSKQSAPELNLSQVHNQLSELSKSKHNDLKITVLTQNIKTESNSIKSQLEDHQPVTHFEKDFTDNLKENIHSDKVDAKLNIQITSNNNQIKDNIKQNENNINFQANNKPLIIENNDLLNIKQINPESENNQSTNKDLWGETKQNLANKENDIKLKEIKPLFTLANASSVNPQLFDNQAKTQFFQNVRLQELPELTNKFIQIATREGSIKANISLFPENLGMLFVQISFNDGGITMTIKAEKSSTLEKISGSIANLMNNLNEQGLKVENIKLVQDKTTSSEDKYTDGRNNNSEQRGGYEKEYREFLLKTRNSKLINL